MSFQPGWYSTPSLGPTTFQYFQTPTLVTSQGYFDGSNQIFQWGKQQFPNGQPGQWTSDMTPLKTAGDGDWWDNPKTGKVKPNNQPKPGPIANTQGIIVPQTSPNLSGTTSAPTPTAPEGKEEKGWWGSWGSDVTHGVLDVIGLVPVVGEVANGVGALIYVAEGDYVNAALDAAAMWPAGGQAATAAKYGKKGVGAVAEQVEKKAARETEEALRERLAKEAREKAAREKAEKEAADKKAREEAEGGKVKKQKPHKDCGKSGKYKNLPKEKGVINADHVPSGAALKKAFQKKLEDAGIWQSMTAKQRESALNHLYREAPAISIPEDVHKEGRTYAGKNTGKQSTADAGNLRDAVKKDTDAIQKSMDGKDHGCSEAYRKAAEEMQNFDFDGLFDEIIRDNEHIKKVVKKLAG